MSRLTRNAEILLGGVTDEIEELSTDAVATVSAQSALAYATLALVEEQRTANLLAWRAAITDPQAHSDLIDRLKAVYPELHTRFYEVSADIRQRLDLPPRP